MDSIQSVVEYLIGQNYAVWTGGKLLFTNNFYRDCTPPEDPFAEVRQVPTPIREQFQRFMEDAEVPFRVQTSDGSQYTVKITSPIAIKAYQDALRKVSYEDLVRITKWYYKQTKLMRKTVANYLSEELYMGALEELKKKGQATTKSHFSLNQ